MSTIDKIVSDLNERGMRVITFVCEDKNGDIVCLSYNKEGLVTDITRPVKGINVNEHRGGRVFSPMFKIRPRPPVEQP